MKTLSIKQPWAALIADGIKDVENRTWKTKFRGKILIHASANYDKNIKLRYPQFDKMMEDENIDLAWAIKNYSKYPVLTTSAIIGEVEIVDCVQNYPSIWSEVDLTGTKPIWNWVLKNAKLYDEPILKVKGKLMLWEYPKI